MSDYMLPKNIHEIKGHIIFDHDGTLVNTETRDYFVYPQMKEFLMELKNLGFELYIWTARPRRSTLEIIKSMNIANYFTEIFCYDDGIPKPHPMGLAHLTPDIDKKKILHIGDSMTDIEGAKAYGIEVVLACWNNPNQVKSMSKLADYTAHEIADVKAIVKEKFKE